MSGKDFVLDPLGSGGAANSGGQKVAAVNEQMLTQRICDMSNNVEKSLREMQALRKISTDMLLSQEKQIQRTDALLENSEELNTNVAALNKTSQDSLDVLKEIRDTSKDMVEAVRSMDVNLKALSAISEANVKQLSMNTAMIFVSNVTKQEEGETPETFFFRLWKNANDLLEEFEKRRKEEIEKAAQATQT